MQGSGVGAAKWLMLHGAQLVITDLKTEDELKESIEEVMKWFKIYREKYPDKQIYEPVFALGEHRDEDFTDVDFVVQNPDVPRESRFLKIAEENGVPILSDISIFFLLCPFPIVAITGAKGKTTTTTLVGEMMKLVDARTIVAGNIKVSPLEYLDEILKDERPRPIILELSSWLLESLERIGRGPDIGVV